MNVGRNDLCPCGSGKKYKKCCAAVKKTETNQPKERELTDYEDLLYVESEYLAIATMEPWVLHDYLFNDYGNIVNWDLLSSVCLSFIETDPTGKWDKENQKWNYEPSNVRKEYLQRVKKSREESGAKVSWTILSSSDPKSMLPFYAPILNRAETWKIKEDPYDQVVFDVHYKFYENSKGRIRTLSELEEITRFMEEEAVRAYEIGMKTEDDVVKYNSAIRWIISTLAARVGIDFHFIGNLKTDKDVPQKCSELFHLSAMRLNEIAHSDDTLRLIIHSLAVYILQGKHAVIPHYSVVRHLSLVHFSRFSQHFELISAYGELVRSIISKWTREDNEKLAHLISSRFMSLWALAWKEEIQGQFNQAVFDYVADKFNIERTIDSYYIEDDARLRLYENEKNLLSDSNSSNLLFDMITSYESSKIFLGDKAVLPDLDKNHESDVQKVLEQFSRVTVDGQLIEDCDSNGYDKNADIFFEVFLDSFAAEGSPRLHKILNGHMPRRNWHMNLHERSRDALEAADYDFMSFMDPMRKRPKDCKSIFNNYADAVEAELWHRFFLPVIASLSKDMDLDDKFLKTKSKKYKTKILAEAILACRSTSSSPVKKLTLGPMGRIIMWVRESADEILSNPEYCLLYKKFLLNARVLTLVRASLPAAMKVFHDFTELDRNEAKHPNSIITFEEALMKRRIALAILRWMTEELLPVNVSQYYFEDMGMIPIDLDSDGMSEKITAQYSKWGPVPMIPRFYNGHLPNMTLSLHLNS